MTPEETNKFIHEKIMGKCWHDFEQDEEIPRWRKGIPHCKRCQASMGPYAFNPDYTQWEHYGPMLEVLKDGPMLEVLKGTEQGCHAIMELTYDELLNPTRGCQAIVEFFGKEK